MSMVRELWVHDGTENGRKQTVRRFANEQKRRKLPCEVVCFTDDTKAWRDYLPWQYLYPVKEFQHIILRIVYRNLYFTGVPLDSRVGIICDFSKDVWCSTSWSCSESVAPHIRLFWYQVWREVEKPYSDLYLITPIATENPTWCNLFQTTWQTVEIYWIHLTSLQLVKLVTIIRRLKFLKRLIMKRLTNCCIYKFVLPIKLPLDLVLPSQLATHIPLINEYVDCDVC
jgi:hypothetical protein